MIVAYARQIPKPDTGSILNNTDTTCTRPVPLLTYHDSPAKEDYRSFRSKQQQTTLRKRAPPAPSMSAQTLYTWPKDLGFDATTASNNVATDFLGRLNAIDL